MIIDNRNNWIYNKRKSKIVYNKILAFGLFFIASSVIGSENSSITPLKKIIHYPNIILSYNTTSCPLTFFYNLQYKQGVICHTQGEFKINIVKRVSITEEQHKTLSSKLLTTHKNLYFNTEGHPCDCYYEISVVQKLCAKGMQRLQDWSTTRI